jgi:nanoRNase/pAp phosphatase (c-di-AMP/oligoRNAs hydrolase)
MAEAGASGGTFAGLRAAIDPARPLAVQTHDFPDLDAVASAWGLACLLRLDGVEASCVYRGRIRSRSLASLVSELGLSIANEAPPSTPDAPLQLIVVDGSPSNGNVSLFDGELVAVIDHHCSQALPHAACLDIRPELAACSTIVQGYWSDAGKAIPRDVATALIAGIQSDTDFLSRRASPRDFAAYTELFGAGEFDRASRIVRTAFDLRELDLVVEALDAAVVREGMLWAFLRGGCGQEVLAVLAEFVLRAEELRAAVVAERGEHFGAAGAANGTSAGPEQGIHISVRSKDPSLSAFDLVRRALAGCGTGGGHAHSAGGFVLDAAFPGESLLRDRFFAAAREIQA